ncbi:MAG TPA: ferredoxin [Candidatus Moranbacteria bacterium]|nr:ferredoxin [Candidatus Moranbacteria bacterium]
MKVTVDEEKCIGCQTCTLICPDCFEMDGSIAKVKDGCNGENCDPREAAEGCPVGAIVVEE